MNFPVTERKTELGLAMNEENNLFFFKTSFNWEKRILRGKKVVCVPKKMFSQEERFFRLQ